MNFPKKIIRTKLFKRQKYNKKKLLTQLKLKIKML